ncbi:MAG TPA: DUF222 domain-containing protein [Actinomycetota bacterium]
MLSVSVSELDQVTAELHAAIDRVQRVAARASDGATDLAVSALRAADRLTATATSVIARGGFSAGAGLPAPIMLQMEARTTSWDARTITRIAGILTGMPDTASAFEEGVLSWSQIRAITDAAKPCDTAGRERIDRLIARRATSQSNADPDQIVADVQDEAATIRKDLTERREQRAVEQSFIAFQPRLDGRTFFYGEGDHASVAGLVDSLDAAAGPPKPDGRPRAQHRYDALIALTSQNPGGNRASRARPRIIAALDLAELTRNEQDAAARILWALTGRPPRLSPIGTQTLLCDADVLPIIFDNGQPIAIGHPTSPIPRRIRRAIEARDQGCRFPGCHAPLDWTDLHHIIHRINGGRSAPENLISLCRRCHRRIHDHGWKITINPGGNIIFTRRGRRYESPPPTGPPLLE